MTSKKEFQRTDAVSKGYGHLCHKYRLSQGCKRNGSVFKTVQNKMHYAVTGKTAAEIIATRANGNRIGQAASDQFESSYKMILAFFVPLAYYMFSKPAAPLLKSMRNPVGFCFLRSTFHEV